MTARLLRPIHFHWTVVVFLVLTTVFNMATAIEENAAGDEEPKVPLLNLRDGNRMPMIGMGVYRADPGQEAYLTVQWALEVGYRLIDTAAVYGNEADVGRAIADSGIPREQIFITTKIDKDSHGYEKALAAADDCLERLGTEYIDLLLIHSPFGGKIVETWDALVQLQKDGKVKSIGVSNFGVKHLKAILDYGRPLPVVNQIELHPLNFEERKELRIFCKQNLIRITAYGSLFGGQSDRFADSMLHYLAKKYKKTVPQILLRWALDSNYAIIPKASSSKERVKENFDILDFKLDPKEVNVVGEMRGKPLDEYWDPVKDAEVDIGDTSHGINLKFMKEEL